MRAVILLSLLLAAGTASAESTISLKDLPEGGKTEDSIIRIGCSVCPAPKPKTSGYLVPDVPKGQSRFELKTVKGEQLIYRADAMLGGSPVLFISKATPEWIAALKLTPTDETADAKDGIDTTATTSALANSPLPPAVKKAFARRGQPCRFRHGSRKGHRRRQGPCPGSHTRSHSGSPGASRCRRNAQAARYRKLHAPQLRLARFTPPPEPARPFRSGRKPLCLRGGVWRR